MSSRFARKRIVIVKKFVLFDEVIFNGVSKMKQCNYFKMYPAFLTDLYNISMYFFIVKPIKNNFNAVCFIQCV